jgi:hypothetical protein
MTSFQSSPGQGGSKRYSKAFRKLLCSRPKAKRCCKAVGGLKVLPGLLCCPLSKAYLTRALLWLHVRQWRRKCQIHSQFHIVSQHFCWQLHYPNFVWITPYLVRHMIRFNGQMHNTSTIYVYMRLVGGTRRCSGRRHFPFPPPFPPPLLFPVPAPVTVSHPRPFSRFFCVSH